MGFFNTLRRLLGHEQHTTSPESMSRRLRDAWGLDEEMDGNSSAASQPTSQVSAYDRAHWQKKLRHILNSLPQSREQWDALHMEANALKFEPEWVSRNLLEEFTFLIRRAVADRVVSEEEHENIELARRLIGLSEDEAVELLRKVMAEAEAIFGGPVEQDR